MTSIVLVDDHAVVRLGVRALLEETAGWTVVGEAADGPAALQVVAARRPDVAVVDLSLPSITGLEVVRQTRHLSPGTRSIVLSMHEDPSHVRGALAAGARGFVCKAAVGDELLNAVSTVLQGERFLSSSLEVAGDWGELDEDPLAPLTPREREVFFLTAVGRTARQAAEELHLSRRTVEVHRGSIYGKLELDGQPDLIAFAHRHRLVTRST